MTIDRSALDTQLTELGLTIADIGKRFESSFETVKTAERDAGIPQLGAALSFTPEPESDDTVEVLGNFEAFATGDTPKEALAEFRRKMDAWPKAGSILFWRCPPECDWSYDFQRSAPVWKIYARVALK